MTSYGKLHSFSFILGMKSVLLFRIFFFSHPLAKKVCGRKNHFWKKRIFFFNRQRWKNFSFPWGRVRKRIKKSCFWQKFSRSFKKVDFSPWYSFLANSWSLMEKMLKVRRTLAVAVNVGWLGAVKSGALVGVQQVGVRVQALWHFVADDIDQPLEDGLENRHSS